MKILTFYNEKQVIDAPNGYSRSPLKPKLLLEYLKEQGLGQHFEIKSDFLPFNHDDFYIAHTQEYIDGFFAGEPKYRSRSNLEWSAEFAESVRYTNSSLYNAIRHSVLHPGQICFSPSSGFHHARPDGGAAFCTFSGQVIASVKIYRELGLKAVWLDLDGHFGNSIEDSRAFTPDLNKAVPIGFNINPSHRGKEYVQDFKSHLARVSEALITGQIDYLVFCHGADSHEWDDLGHQCSTDEWLECSDLFYSFVDEIEVKLGRKIPLSLSLFGGYREDDYNSVLSLHTADLARCLGIDYTPVVKPPLTNRI